MPAVNGGLMRGMPSNSVPLDALAFPTIPISN